MRPESACTLDSRARILRQPGVNVWRLTAKDREAGVSAVYRTYVRKLCHTPSLGY